MNKLVSTAISRNHQSPAARRGFTVGLDFWDFTGAVTPFFGHWAGVVSLPAIMAHYGMMVLGSRRTAPKGGQEERQAGEGASRDAARA